MKVLERIKVFYTFNNETKILFIEAIIFLAFARILKGMPFNKIAPSLGEEMAETTFIANDSKKKIIAKISDAIEIMSRNTLWESMCLVQAIAAMKMLRRRQIESTIYFGTARDKSGKFVAHAWLRSGPYYITGAEVMDQFVVVKKFANKRKSKV